MNYNSGMITCYVTPGEYLDKYSILLIKKERFSDPQKLAEVEIELSRFTDEIIGKSCIFNELKATNEKLWDCNDARKQAIKNGRFDEEFVALSIFESTLNDMRNLIKNQINKEFGSILEHKSYL